jgi:hypothetical protein
MKFSFFFQLLLFSFFNHSITGQTNCPSIGFQNKWSNDTFGIEITCNRITILDKNNNWQESKKQSDSYFFIEPIITNEEKSYTGGIRNFTTGNIITSQKKAKKVPTIQYRFVKMKLNDDGTLNFTISEKSVKYANMSRANWVAINEDEGLFEKTFNLNKIEIKSVE